MNSIKYAAKCIGRACGLQSSEFHNVYEDLKNTSALGVNTQTRKNKLAQINARLRSLQATRAKKTNLAKINALRLAHNVLNAQGKGLSENNSKLLSRYRNLSRRQNKHETEELVKQMLNTEIRPIRKRKENYNAKMYANKLQWTKITSDFDKLAKGEKLPKDPKVIEEELSQRAVIEAFPRLDLTKQKDLFLKLLEYRKIVLMALLTKESDIQYDIRKKQEVDKLWEEKIVKDLPGALAYKHKNVMNLRAALAEAMGNQGKKRKTRKMSRRY